ncbi:MAG: CPBP family glutamic-type intramembrane protease [Vicinamibacterales bacterium]
MPDLPVTASAERGKWTLVAACVVAGGLSVRLDGLGTPLAAMGAGLVGWLALLVWEWSRLPSFMRSRAEHDHAWRMLQPLRWLTLGLVVGLVLLAVIKLVIEPAVPSIGMRIAAAGALPVWRRVIIIYVAAVIEEMIFRLFLLSAIVGFTIRFLRRTTLVPTAGIVWTANAASALAFAAVHLPSWTGATPGNAALTLSVIALNVAAGLVIGCVFATRGIAPAMWTHAGGDCAIQLLGPLTG